jgi:Pyruvate/2-oxoacid:ferredoxin oxidoreductase delta subunit
MCLHNWSSWSELILAYDGVFQYKYCKKCNLIRSNCRGRSIYFNLAVWNKKQENSNE